MTARKFPLPSMPPAARSILESAAEYHASSVREILSRKRQQHIVRARQRAMAELSDRGWSLERIAIVMRRDHSTVHHGIGAHRARQVVA